MKRDECSSYLVARRRVSNRSVFAPFSDFDDTFDVLVSYASLREYTWSVKITITHKIAINLPNIKNASLFIDVPIV